MKRFDAPVRKHPDLAQKKMPTTTFPAKTWMKAQTQAASDNVRAWLTPLYHERNIDIPSVLLQFA